MLSNMLFRHRPIFMNACSQLCTTSGINDQSYVRLTQLLCDTGSTMEKQTDSKFVSTSHRLLLHRKLLQHTASGLFTLSPLLMRSLNKLKRLVHRRMREIGAQQIKCPSLGTRDLWESCGRWAPWSDVLFKTTDRRGHTFCLQPTHEEMVTQLVAAAFSHVPHTDLPVLVYQMTDKYRDEYFPRMGLLRAREFLMKDLYSFDWDENTAMNSYDLVTGAYRKLFEVDLRLPYYRCLASTGVMGGDLSHEFHLEHPAGQDTLIKCPSCHVVQNKELLTNHHSSCANCRAELTKQETEQPIRTFEMAHTFLLGTKYSQKIGANVAKDGETQPLVMGCYGIGVTRLIGAALDLLSTDEQMVWPQSIAPIEVVVVPPKDGSNEESIARPIANNLAVCLAKTGIDTGIDDRTKYTIGRLAYMDL